MTAVDGDVDGEGVKLGIGDGVDFFLACDESQLDFGCVPSTK